MANQPALTANGQRLILKLAELPREWVTAAVLAQELGISRRTVMRELQNVEQWMQAAGYVFHRSPGHGLLLDETPERREELCRCVTQENGKNIRMKEERRQDLLGLLLATMEPQKTYTLASALMVSENTLASDLDWAAQWCNLYQIELCRRPGVGVWLKGSSNARRRASGVLLRGALLEQQRHTALQKDPPSMPLVGLVESDILQKVWHILWEFEEEEHVQLSDAGFLTLLVHCVLTIQQIKAGIWQPGADMECADHFKLYKGENLALRLEQACQFQLPPEERRHLALALHAYALHRVEEWDAPDALALHGLAAALIDAVEEYMDVDLSRYPTLSQDLCNHLKPMLYRIKQGIPAENPQLGLIQTKYSRLWQATRKACDRVLSEIPDAEAGFLAMHFGAVIDEENLINLRVRCVVVCPYGMATSKFLSAQLMQEFPELHIENTCSIRTLRCEELYKQNIDLIISTVPLEVDYRQVCVNPILQQADRTKLQSAIKSVHLQPVARTKNSDHGTLRRAGKLSLLMLDVLDHLVIETVPVCGSRADLIEAASHLFCRDSVQAKVVCDAFWRREKIGDTYIKPLRALLLHARVRVVSGCRLGYLRADPPIYENGKMMQGALVLLAPETGAEPLEVMQAVSSLLIEDSSLIAALRKTDRDLASSILEKGLGRQLDWVLHRGES